MTERPLQCCEIIEPFRSDLVQKMANEHAEIERKILRLLRKNLTVKHQEDLLDAFERYQKSRNAFLLNKPQGYMEWRKDYLFRLFDVTSKIRFLEFMFNQKGGVFK